MNLAAEVVEQLTVTIDQWSLGAETTVDFTVVDGADRGAVGLAAGSRGNVRFSLAKLLPGPAQGDPSAWRSMVNRARGDAPNQVTQAYYDRTGTLVDNLDGTYRYTFDNDLTTQTDPVSGEAIPFEPNLTHRMVIQVSGRVNGNRLPPVNEIMDFVPAGGEVTENRKVIRTESCNECHGELTVHGSRYDADYCVVCHNTFTGSEGTDLPIADMSYMTHAIHGAGYREARGGPAYVIDGDDYSGVGYPQDLRHCQKCHAVSDETPEGDNWKEVPNVNSCGGCHQNPNYEAHVGNQNNSACALCHGPSSTLQGCGPDNGNCSIEAVHLTVNPTTNNPQVPAGVSVIEYEIDEMTVDATRQANIRFRVLRDGTPLDLLNLPADLTRGPSFLIAYAMPQDGFMEPIDYNNLGNGRAASQPTSVSVSALAAGTEGSLTGPDANGFYTGITNFQFPVGATMRAVTLQGYYNQTGVPQLGEVARHTISVVATATGDVPRREVVDSNKCASCHEWFEAHGGNRVFDVQACVMCHNPNLTSSGRGFDATSVDGVDDMGAPDPGEQAAIARLQAILDGDGVMPANPLMAGPLDPSNPLTWPEESNNMREMIHGIHAAAMRSGDFAFVRVFRGSARPYNFSHVTYPNALNACEACHNEGTYDTDLPAGELAGTRIVPSPTPDDRTSINAARGMVPNPEDIVTSPAAAACGSCHDSLQAKNHMILNGAYVDAPRSGLLAGNLESCNVCHGAGRSSDSATAHSGR